MLKVIVLKSQGKSRKTVLQNVSRNKEIILESEGNVQWGAEDTVRNW